MAQNLKTGDLVKVISGQHKGKTAKIVGVNRQDRQAMLDGIGLRERHIRATQYNPKGGKKTVHQGLDFSKLKLIEAAKYEKTANETKRNTKKGAK